MNSLTMKRDFLKKSVRLNNIRTAIYTNNVFNDPFSSSTAFQWIAYSSGTSIFPPTPTTSNWVVYDDETWADGCTPPRPVLLPAGEYLMADGSTLTIHADKSWTLVEAEKKTTYRGNRDRDFNRFVNASDIMEDFCRFVGGLGIGQKDAFDLPLKLFIMYLIIEAAKQDQEDYKSDEAKLRVEAEKNLLPICCFCGASLSREKASRKVFFCSGDHMDRFEAEGAQRRSQAIVEAIAAEPELVG